MIFKHWVKKYINNQYLFKNIKKSYLFNRNFEFHLLNTTNCLIVIGFFF